MLIKQSECCHVLSPQPLRLLSRLVAYKRVSPKPNGSWTLAIVVLVRVCDNLQSGMSVIAKKWDISNLDQKESHSVC